MTDKYTLNWLAFSEHLPLMFKELYEIEKHSGVTLGCAEEKRETEEEEDIPNKTSDNKIRNRQRRRQIKISM